MLGWAKTKGFSCHPHFQYYQYRARRPQATEILNMSCTKQANNNTFHCWKRSKRQRIASNLVEWHKDASKPAEWHQTRPIEAKQRRLVNVIHYCQSSFIQSVQYYLKRHDIKGGPHPPVVINHHLLSQSHYILVSCILNSSAKRWRWPSIESEAGWDRTSFVSAQKVEDVLCGDGDGFIWHHCDHRFHTDSVVKWNALCIMLFWCLPLFHLSD